jgi:ankyrin repeat protein
MVVTLGDLPEEVLALIFAFLSRVDPKTTLGLPTVCRKFRNACQRTRASFALLGVDEGSRTLRLSAFHQRIATWFPNTVTLITRMETARNWSSSSLHDMRCVLRKCRNLCHLEVHKSRMDVFSMPELDWQRAFSTELEMGRKTKLRRLTIKIGVKPDTDASTEKLLRSVAPRLEELDLTGLDMDYTGVAVLSSMEKLKRLKLDSTLLTLDMPNPDGPEALLPDVLAAARWYTERATLPVPRLEEFIDRWGPDFHYNHCRLLDWAVAAENVDFVQTLLNRGASPHMVRGTVTNSSPIWAAVKSRNVTIARLLLMHGASPNECPKTAFAGPLHMAAQQADHAMISLLFEHGVNPHAVDRAGYTAMAVAAKLGLLSVINLLHVLGAPTNNRHPQTVEPIEAACIHNEAYCVSRLIVGGAKIFRPDDSRPCLLFEAVSKGRLAVVESLLYGGGNANTAHNNQKTALCVAIMRDDFSLVAMLLVSGADANAESLEDERTGVISSPLHHAVNLGSFQIAELLIQQGASTKAIAGDGISVLLRARLRHRTAIVGLLLEHGADPKVGNVITKEPALVGAC